MEKLKVYSGLKISWLVIVWKFEMTHELKLNSNGYNSRALMVIPEWEKVLF